ncbi:MAG: phosphatase PAP2 family protein [Ignavibacteriales bacterium]|nr:phosphatase PAP2 family protein [Ignavibacteriales bacterium]MCB9220012.1 phosphatase PAP2 family protein [Ignavibacteriales bacterium]
MNIKSIITIIIIVSFNIISIHPILAQEVFDTKKQLSFMQIKSNNLQSNSNDRKFSNDISDFTGSVSRVLTSPFSWNKKDFYHAGGFLLLCSGSFFLDKEVRNIFLKNRNKTFDNLERVGYSYGSPLYSISGGLLTYLTGLTFNNNWVRETGLMLTETLVIIGIIQVPTRIIFGRARPYNGFGSTSFKFLNGMGQDRASFISGHAAIAIGMSNILAHQIDHPIATIGLYGLAAITPLSRLYDDKHWFSDVFIGSALGLFISNAVIRFHEESSLTKSNFSLTPLPNGISLWYRF